MPIQLVTGPVVEPMDLAEARLHLKLDDTSDDTLVTALVSASREFAHTKTQRQIVAARYRQVLDGFPQQWSFRQPSNAILLEKTPLIQVVSIQYLDTGNVWQTMATADYVVDDASEPARITPPFGKIWPIAQPQMASVRVLFDAGDVARIVADATADTVTVTGWEALAVNDVVRFSNSGGTLPAPLLVNTDYYVQSVPSAGVYKLSATIGGPVIDLTTAGTGTNYLGSLPEGLKAWMKLRLGAMYENREEAAILQRAVSVELPFVDSLLDPYRMVLC